MTWSDGDLLTPTNLENKSNAPVFNVKDFGAVGDGSTDDRAAIQKAIDAAKSADGGTVFFPSNNTFSVTTDLTIESPNLAFEGAGRSSVVSAGGTSFTSGVFSMPSRHTGISFEKFRIETDGLEENKHILHLRGATDCLVSNMWFTETPNAATNTAAVLLRLESETGDVRRCIVSDNHFNVSNIAVLVQNAFDVTLCGNIVSGDNQNHSVSGSLKVDTSSENVSIIGNVVRGANNIEDAIFISEGFRGVTVQGNIVSDVTGAGITIDQGQTDRDSDQITVVGNSVDSCGLNGITVGFSNASLADIVVSDNVCTNVGGSFGIGVDGGSNGENISGCVVSSNVLTDYGTAGIQIRADGALVTGNYCESNKADAEGVRKRGPCTIRNNDLSNNSSPFGGSSQAWTLDISNNRGAETLTFSDGDTTPSIGEGDVFETANGSTTTIANFDGGVDGKRIRVLAEDANTGFQHGTNIFMKSASSERASDGSTFQFVRNSNGSWMEV